MTSQSQSVASVGVHSGARLGSVLTHRDWSTIRAALWAYRCAEQNSRRGCNRVMDAEVFEASAKRERQILRTLVKCKYLSLPNVAVTNSHTEKL
jgi:hypothetical protein